MMYLKIYMYRRHIKDIINSSKVWLTGKSAGLGYEGSTFKTGMHPFVTNKKKEKKRHINSM